MNEYYETLKLTDHLKYNKKRVQTLLFVISYSIFILSINNT
jgi:hypothetical protein